MTVVLLLTRRGRPHSVDVTTIGRMTVQPTPHSPLRSRRALLGAITLGPAIALALAVAAVAAPAPGRLDPRFSDDGVLVENFQNNGWGMAVALQRDGKILASGQENTVDSQMRNVAVVRYLGNGTHDPTWGGNGVVFTDLAGGPSDFARDVAVQRDGRVLAGGSGGVGLDFAVVRYLPDGTLDPGFGGGLGYVLTNITGNDVIRGLAIQEDGKIVGAGFVHPGPNFAVARYLPSGSLDPTFGDGGRVVTDVQGADNARGIALQTDGKIVVVGYASYDFAVLRYLTDGSLDQSFGTGGKVITDLGQDDVCRAVAIQDDGKIICGGYTGDGGGLDPEDGPGSAAAPGTHTGDFAMVRYLENGSLDPTFGDGGVVISDVGTAEHARTIVIQADGKIVLAGHRAEPVLGPAGGGGTAPGDFVIARYLPDGTIDETFGADGWTWHDLGGDDGIRDAVIQQRDGKIAVVGISGSGGYQFAAARYTGGG
jgi:uncharacterized delta-60 repeat protein